MATIAYFDDLVSTNPHSPEVRAKNNLKRRGQKRTPEQRERMRQAALARAARRRASPDQPPLFP